MTTTTCPRHLPTGPQQPRRPFVPENSRQPYKCCMSPAGSAGDAANHYCPCCGDKLDGCMRSSKTVECWQCGLITDRQFVVDTDEVADMLETGEVPSEYYPLVQRARALFGEGLAYYMTPNSDRRTEYLGWDVRIGRSMLALRWYHAEQEFRAGSPCPNGCRNGQVWTPVYSLDALIRLRRLGPGADAYPCRLCVRAGRY